MNTKPVLSAAIVCGFVALAARAQALLAAVPAVSATCKDGTNWSGAQRSGACGRHGGVKAFDKAAPAEQVWVNTKSKVYHCPAEANYGKTKVGVYMTETAAKTAGDRPSAGKTCF